VRLTTLTDYALRLLIYLAQRPERLCTISEVAGSYGVSKAHMMKITHQLGLAGWIQTVRGKGGGMRLAQMPQAICLGAVVRSIEPDFFLVECFSPGNTCILTGTCKLTGVIQGALQSFMDYLDGSTLADILPALADPLATQVIHMTVRIRAHPA
jgi:Rrf2 family nitric oxide-sensitive transcriptional repressor